MALPLRKEKFFSSASPDLAKNRDAKRSKSALTLGPSHSLWGLNHPFDKA